MNEEKKMKVLVVRPGKKPELAEIGTTLESWQEAVGGYVERLYPFEDLG